jgi:hypothetical protein
VTPGAAAAAFEFAWPTARAAALAGAEVALASGRPATLVSGQGEAPCSAHGGGSPGPREADGGASPDSASGGPALTIERVELSGGELYGVPEARGFLVSASIGSRLGSAALTVGRLGGDLYQERTVGVAFARPLREALVVEVGCRVLAMGASGVSERAAVAVDASVASRILGRVVLAAAWRNLGDARLGESPVAAGASVGATFVLDGISLTGSIELDSGAGATVAFGSEAAVSDWLRFRAGVSLDPGTFAAGIGIGNEARTRAGPAPSGGGLLARPVVDLAVTWHPDLGGSSFATITFLR